jgi:hypothetical protein
MAVEPPDLRTAQLDALVAIDSFLAGPEQHGIIKMFCGTGKSRVMLECVEFAKRGSISAIVMPSIALVTRRNPDDPDAYGTVVLMVHIDMAKYKACSTDAERSTALRQDMRNAARGNFAVVANFLLALQAEDPAFMYAQCERRPGSGKPQPPKPQQQPKQRVPPQKVAAKQPGQAAKQPRQPRTQAGPGRFTSQQ